MYFIGVDHHKQVSVMTVLDEDGRELKNGRVFPCFPRSLILPRLLH